MFDNYYMDSVPVSPWPLSSRPPPRRKSLTNAYIQSDPYDDEWDQNVDYLHGWGYERSVMPDDGHYFDDVMPPELVRRPSLSRRRSYADSPSHRRSQHNDNNKSYYHYQQKHPLDHNIDDHSDIQLEQKKHYRQRPLHNMEASTAWVNSPIMGHSPISRNHHQAQGPVLHQQWHSRLDQGPVLDTDTQHPPSLYGRVPPIVQPPMLPMLQPMIHAPQPHHHLNYGFPTISGMMPETVIPFNPMIMPQPSHLHFQNDINSNTNPQQQLDITPTLRTTEVDAPSIPSSEDITKDSSDLNTKPSTPNINNEKPENSLVPLVRSLSLGSSQSSKVKPRRRSLFESLFNLDGPSRTSSLSSANSADQDSLTSPNTSASSSTLSSSLIPLNELTTRSLSRRQSLSLEKTAKALSQRSYIWCYRVNPSRGGVEDPCWVALTPKNQTKLDPYLVYYHPGAVKKVSTRNLPTLVTLDKEPKLTGSFTAMPQAKIGRVYPSMFSSANYIELLLDCLPADSQFAVRSD